MIKKISTIIYFIGMILLIGLFILFILHNSEKIMIHNVDVLKSLVGVGLLFLVPRMYFKDIEEPSVINSFVNRKNWAFIVMNTILLIVVLLFILSSK